MSTKKTVVIICDYPGCNVKFTDSYFSTVKIAESSAEHHGWIKLPGLKHICPKCKRLFNENTFPVETPATVGQETQQA